MSDFFESPAVRRDLAGINWDAFLTEPDDGTEEISDEIATDAETATDDNS